MINKYWQHILGNIYSDHIGKAHHKNIHLSYLFGQLSNDGGICYGIATTAAQAALSGENAIRHFSYRFALTPLIGAIFGDILSDEFIQACLDPASSPDDSVVYQAIKSVTGHSDEELQKLMRHPGKFSNVLKSLMEDEAEEFVGELLFFSVAKQLNQDGAAGQLAKKLWHLNLEEEKGEDDSFSHISMLIRDLTEQNIKYFTEKARTAENKFKETQYKQMICILSDILEMPDNELLSIIQEIPAWLETVNAYFNSDIYSVQLAGGSKPSKETPLEMKHAFGKQHWSGVEPFYRSAFLEKQGGMYSPFNMTDQVSQDELKNIFNYFFEKFSFHAGLFSFLCYIRTEDDRRHSFSFGYDAQRKSWWLMDPNLMPALWLPDIDALTSAIFYLAGKYFIPADPDRELIFGWELLCSRRTAQKNSREIAATKKYCQDQHGLRKAKLERSEEFVKFKQSLNLKNIMKPQKNSKTSHYSLSSADGHMVRSFLKNTIEKEIKPDTEAGIDQSEETFIRMIEEKCELQHRLSILNLMEILSSTDQREMSQNETGFSDDAYNTYKVWYASKALSQENRFPLMNELGTIAKIKFSSWRSPHSDIIRAQCSLNREIAALESRLRDAARNMALSRKIISHVSNNSIPGEAVLQHRNDSSYEITRCQALNHVCQNAGLFAQNDRRYQQLYAFFSKGASRRSEIFDHSPMADMPASKNGA